MSFVSSCQKWVTKPGSTVVNAGCCVYVDGLFTLYERDAWLHRTQAQIKDREQNHRVSGYNQEGYSVIDWTGYRQHGRLLYFESTAFLTFLWERVKPHLPETIHSSDDGKVWCLVSLNRCIRANKYVAGGLFDVHVDDAYVNKDLRLRSFLTLMVYLNDVTEDAQGGRTLFFDSTNTTVAAATVKPVAGRVILFSHGMTHSGEELQFGEKYVWRTDVVYCCQP